MCLIFCPESGSVETDCVSQTNICSTLSLMTHYLQLQLMKKLRESILEDRCGMIVLIFLDSLLQIQSKAIIAFSTFLEPHQYFYILPGSLLSWKISSSNSSPTSTFQLGRARLSLVLALTCPLSCHCHCQWLIGVSCAPCIELNVWSWTPLIACNSHLHLWRKNINLYFDPEETFPHSYRK